jgi:hypothetical protein
MADSKSTQTIFAEPDNVNTWIKYTCMEVTSKEKENHDLLSNKDPSGLKALAAVVGKQSQLWKAGEVSYYLFLLMSHIS